jgi:phosphoglycolate phosphatase
MSLTVYFTDLDGTLEDSRADMANAVLRVRQELKLPAWKAEQARPFVNKGMRELYLNCFADFLEIEVKKGIDFEAAVEKVRHLYEAQYLSHVAVETKLYPQMDEVLKTLSQKGKVVVITNKPEHISRALLRELGVADLIADVMGGDSCAECKPSPLPLQIAAQKLGFNPQYDKAFMMGDTLADIQCGKAFGAKTIWCGYGYQENPPSEQSDWQVRQPIEILRLIS